jgi:TPR repeat protein
MENAHKAFNEDNYALSLEMFKTLAKEGYVDAMYMHGLHYKEGCGVEMDQERAISIWKRASKRGSLDAQYALLEITQTTTQCCKG